MMLILAVCVGLLPMVPAVIYFLNQRGKSPTEATRSLVYGLNGFNVLLGMMATAFGIRTPRLLPHFAIRARKGFTSTGQRYTTDIRGKREFRKSSQRIDSRDNPVDEHAGRSQVRPRVHQPAAS